MLKVKISDRCTLEFDLKDDATPAVVYVGNYSSTYEVAVGYGTVGYQDEIKLTQAELDMLESYAEEVEEAYRIVRGDVDA